MKDSPDKLGMKNRSAEAVAALLPEALAFQAMPWETGFGTDFYGALHVAADYCGIAEVPDIFPGVWQHGSVPPWQQVQAEMCVYCAPKSLPCWVARVDEEQYLRDAGYSRVRAIGLPIVYTRSQATTRIPGSLLIMPMHAIPNDTQAKDSDAYILQLTEYVRHFSSASACISGRCIDSGLWAPLFDSAGINIIRGATVDDATSLSRVRRLFETFEFVTTNSYGSHIPYALHFGAKVSIWGWSEEVTRDYLLRDQLWSRFPAAADRFVSEDTIHRRESTFRRFRVPPHLGITDVALGSRYIGAENKLAPDELRDAFGWTPARLMAANLRQAAWNLTPWRVQQLIRKMHHT